MGPGLADSEPAAPAAASCPGGDDIIQKLVAGEFTRTGRRRGVKWGVFLFSKFVPGPGRPRGAYQATCPFHRPTDNTPCTKTLTVSGDAEEDKINTVRRLMNWCIHAQPRDLASFHQTDFPELAEVPADPVLLACCIDRGAARKPLTDEEIFRISKEEFDLWKASDPGGPAAFATGAASSGARSSGA